MWDCLGRFHHRDESGDLAELDVDHLVQNAVNIVDAGPIQQDFFCSRKLRISGADQAAAVHIRVHADRDGGFL